MNFEKAAKFDNLAWDIAPQAGVQSPTSNPRFTLQLIALTLCMHDNFSSFCHLLISKSTFFEPGRVVQSVTCLATDACLSADPGVASSIPARSHTFVEIDHEIISTVILLLPLIYSRRVVVSYK